MQTSKRYGLGYKAIKQGTGRGKGLNTLKGIAAFGLFALCVAVSGLQYNPQRGEYLAGLCEEYAAGIEAPHSVATFNYKTEDCTVTFAGGNTQRLAYKELMEATR